MVQQISRALCINFRRYAPTYVMPELLDALGILGLSADLQVALDIVAHHTQHRAGTNHLGDSSRSLTLTCVRRIYVKLSQSTCCMSRCSCLGRRHGGPGLNASRGHL